MARATVRLAMPRSDAHCAGRGLPRGGMNDRVKGGGMVRSPIMAGVLVAGLTAGAVSGAGSAAADEAAMPTCTVTQFRLQQTNYGGGAVEMLSGGGSEGCFGAYPFIGVTAGTLGYPEVTMDNYPELAAILKHWNGIDGVPAVSEWVNLAPPVASGMRLAGIDPTMFLQWVNEYDGAGTVNDPVMPPTWPPFLPKALVKDPATIAGGTTDLGVSSPKPTPPPEAAPQPIIVPTPPRASVALPSQPNGNSATNTVPTATSTDITPAAPDGAARAHLDGSAIDAGNPPTAVNADGVTVPCVVASPCRHTVLGHDKWVALPWYSKVRAQIWWYRWWEGASLALVVTAVVGARAVVFRRRNLDWYGNVRGPH